MTVAFQTLPAEFKAVTLDSVTLIITSTPKVVTLKKGESRGVDINDDGVNDISVALRDIIVGNAQVDVTKLSGAEAVAREEGGTTTPTTVARTTPGTSRSTTGIWIVALIVIVGVIIYLVYAKRKKK